MGTALGILHRRVCRSQPSLELLIFSNTVPEFFAGRASRGVLAFRPTYQSANLHAHPRLCGAMSLTDHFLNGRGSHQIARGLRFLNLARRRCRAIRDCRLSDDLERIRCTQHRAVLPVKPISIMPTGEPCRHACWNHGGRMTSDVERASVENHFECPRNVVLAACVPAPGVGPVLATAVVATVADPKSFRSGRNFSAWIGIVPKQHSSGGKNRLGNISKQGDRYLRGLFVAGALAVIRYAKIHGTKHRPWLTALLARRPTKVAAIALANKLARMVWAMMVKGERYKEPVALAA